MLADDRTRILGDSSQPIQRLYHRDQSLLLIVALARKSFLPLDFPTSTTNSRQRNILEYSGSAPSQRPGAIQRSPVNLCDRAPIFKSRPHNFIRSILLGLLQTSAKRLQVADWLVQNRNISTHPSDVSIKWRDCPHGKHLCCKSGTSTISHRKQTQ